VSPHAILARLEEKGHGTLTQANAAEGMNAFLLIRDAVSSGKRDGIDIQEFADTAKCASDVPNNRAVVSYEKILPGKVCEISLQLPGI
jgi:hypothetical protein